MELWSEAAEAHRMGNSPSAVEQRVEHGSKTGVCSLRELKLERVNNEVTSV